MHHRQHRNASGRQTRKAMKIATAQHELLHLVLEQIGACRFDQMHERQFVLQGDGLGALKFFNALGLQSPCVNARIVGHQHHPSA